MKSIVACRGPFYNYRLFFDEIRNFEPILFTNLAYENFEELPDLYRIEYVVQDYKKGDIRVKVEQNVLKIEGKNSKKGNHFFRKDMNYKEKYFIKELFLHDDMDSEHISAKYKNGVLRIEIPKKRVEKYYRKIPVRGEETNEVINENNSSTWMTRIRLRVAPQKKPHQIDSLF